MAKIILFGELLIDHKSFPHKDLPPSAGGPPLFIAHLLTGLPVKKTILACYGPDFPRQWLPKKTSLFPGKPLCQLSPRFYLRYQNGKRSLSINSAGWFKPLLPEKLKIKLAEVKHAKLVFFGSTLPVYPPQMIKRWKAVFTQARLVLLAQGWMRKVINDKMIGYQNPARLFRWFAEAGSIFDAVIFSEEDHKQNVITGLIKRISPQSITVVTRGIKGAMIYYKGETLSLPTRWPVRQNEEKHLDTTGAGDRWAGIFAYRLFIKSLPLKRAAIEAHKVAAYCLGKSMKDTESIPLGQLFQQAKATPGHSSSTCS